MIDLSEQDLAQVKAILKKYVSGCEVRVFGSRVLGTAKKYSDLDLAIVGQTKLSAQTLENIREDFQNSSLPFRVDILDWNSISPEFLSVISQKYEVL